MNIYNFEKAKSAEFSAVGMDGLYQEIKRAKRNCITSCIASISRTINNHIISDKDKFFKGGLRG